MENSENTLFLRVKDNGVGISEEQVMLLNEEFVHGSPVSGDKKRGGIALRNVNSRIRLMFGEDYGLRVFSATGIGTECCVTMPLLMQETDMKEELIRIEHGYFHSESGQYQFDVSIAHGECIGVYVDEHLTSGTAYLDLFKGKTVFTDGRAFCYEQQALAQPVWSAGFVRMPLW